MNSIITALYENFFSIPKEFYNRKQVTESYDKLEKSMQELKEALPTDKEYLIYNYESALNSHNYLETIETFRQGLKLGFSLHKELDD